MRGLAVLLALFAVLTCGAPSVLAGSEAEPEIVDREGNVAYHAYYPGSKDHAYLDVVAMWWSYDPDTDRIEFNLKGADFTSFEGGTPADVKVQCWIWLDLRFPDTTNRVSFRWAQYEYGGPFFSDVNVTQAPQPAIPIENDFAPRFETPGYLTWSVGRHALMRHGDVLAAPDTRCLEEYFPGGVDPAQTVAGTVKIIGASPVTNGNPALSSDATVNLTALEPSQGRDEDGLPKGSKDRTASDAANPEAKTSMVGIVASAVVLGVAAIFRRRDTH